MDSKVLIKKIIGFSLSTWISFILAFFTAPISTRLFVPEELGRIHLFSTYANFLAVILYLGFDQAFVRFYREVPGGKTRGSLFTCCIAVPYALLVASLMASLLFGKSLSSLWFSPDDDYSIYFLLVSTFSITTLRFLNLAYRMESNVKMFTIQGVLITIVARVFYLAAGFISPTYTFAMPMMVGAQLTACLTFIFIQKRLFDKLLLQRQMYLPLAQYSLPLAPSAILMRADSAVPLFIIERTLGVASVGIYSAGLALSHMINIVQSGFNMFWPPFVFENYKTQKGEFYAIHKVLVFGVVIAGLLLILSQDAIFLLLGPNYRSAKVFFPFLMFIPICYIIGETVGFGIDIAKKTHYFVIIFCASFITNIALILLFVKPFGVTGVAIANAIAAIVSLTLKAVIGNRYYKAVDSYLYMTLSVVVLMAASFLQLLIKSLLWKYLSIVALIALTTIVCKSEVKQIWAFSKSILANIKLHKRRN